MLSEDQIRKTFELLKLPLSRMEESSPIHLPCPFEHRHTKPTRESDCQLYFEDGPNLYCFHESCREELYDFSRMLRFFVTGSTRGDCDDLVLRCESNRKLAEEVERQRPELLEQYRGKLVLGEPLQMSSMELLTRRFGPSDVLWIGNKFQSGENFKDHFRTLEEWSKRPPPADWDHTVAATFWPGSAHRANNAVAQRRYLVLEGDSFNDEPLSDADQLAMIAWAIETFNLTLQSLLHSGRISYHAWLDWPGSPWLETNQMALAAMGFDAKTMRKAQPVRLGGAVRTLPDGKPKRQEIFLCK